MVMFGIAIISSLFISWDTCIEKLLCQMFDYPEAWFVHKEGRIDAGFCPCYLLVLE